MWINSRQLLQPVLKKISDIGLHFCMLATFWSWFGWRGCCLLVRAFVRIFVRVFVQPVCDDSFRETKCRCEKCLAYFETCSILKFQLVTEWWNVLLSLSNFLLLNGNLCDQSGITSVLYTFPLITLSQISTVSALLLSWQPRVLILWQNFKLQGGPRAAAVISLPPMYLYGIPLRVSLGFILLPCT